LFDDSIHLVGDVSPRLESRIGGGGGAAPNSTAARLPKSDDLAGISPAGFPRHFPRDGVPVAPFHLRKGSSLDARSMLKVPKLEHQCPTGFLPSQKFGVTSAQLAKGKAASRRPL
jgi:hypothetical protein